MFHVVFHDVLHDVAVGYNFYGTERMYSGTDGREMEVDIFIGIVYYQRLRHMVYDKYQVSLSCCNSLLENTSAAFASANNNKKLSCCCDSQSYCIQWVTSLFDLAFC